MTELQIPQEIRQLAESMGVNVEELAARVQGQQAQSEQLPVPESEQQTQVAEGVRQVPVETDVEREQRRAAVAEQELAQLRQQIQTQEEGRVIGSSGVGPQGQVESPNLGSIEPGIRFAYLNGLISDDDLVNKVGPLLADLLKAHQGGAI